MLQSEFSRLFGVKEWCIYYVFPHLNLSFILNVSIMNFSWLATLTIHHIAQWDSSMPSPSRQQLFSVLSRLDLVDSKYLDTEGDRGPLHSEQDLELLILPHWAPRGWGRRRGGRWGLATTHGWTHPCKHWLSHVSLDLRTRSHTLLVQKYVLCK